MKKTPILLCLMGILTISALFYEYHITQFSVIFAERNPTFDQQQVVERDLKPLFWMVVTVGGFIALTLSYVSWRKYRGEKKQKKKDSNS